MSVSATSSISNLLATPQTAVSNSSTGTTDNTSTGTQTTDTVAISPTAQQFADALKQLSDKLNAYEHQVTWQIDNKTAVTAPTSLNASTGTTTDTNTSTGTTTTDTSNTSTTTTGIANDSTGTTTTDSSNTSTGTATSDAITAGFTALQTKFEGSLTNLTSVQQTQLDTFNQKLATEQTRFQNFITNRTTPSYASVSKQLSDRINAFEHQVTWQIDHGTAVTLPNTLTSSSANTSTGTTTIDTSNTSAGATTPTSNTSTGTTNTSTGTTTTTSNTSTGTTTADAIAAGFAALETAASNQLSNASSDLVSNFQQQQTTLASELTRFTSFISRRAAYDATLNQNQTGTTQDIAA
jgi:hypothetical protein